MILFEGLDDSILVHDVKQKMFFLLNDNMDDKQLVAKNVRYLALDDVSYRHDIYATLYELDQLNIKEIWVEKPPLSERWLDINDRLLKASS